MSCADVSEIRRSLFLLLTEVVFLKMVWHLWDSITSGKYSEVALCYGCDNEATLFKI